MRRKRGLSLIFIRNRKYPILLPELDDLQELRIMLSQRIEQWAEGYLAAGRMEGRMEGRVEGRVEGRMEGRLEGEIGVLSRLLSRRFGPLPTWAAARSVSKTARCSPAGAVTVTMRPCVPARCTLRCCARPMLTPGCWPFVPTRPWPYPACAPS